MLVIQGALHQARIVTNKKHFEQLGHYIYSLWQYWLVKI